MLPVCGDFTISSYWPSALTWLPGVFKSSQYFCHFPINSCLNWFLGIPTSVSVSNSVADLTASFAATFPMHPTWALTYYRCRFDLICVWAFCTRIELWYGLQYCDMGAIARVPETVAPYRTPQQTHGDRSIESNQVRELRSAVGQ